MRDGLAEVREVISTTAPGMVQADAASRTGVSAPEWPLPCQLFFSQEFNLDAKCARPKRGERCCWRDQPQSINHGRLSHSIDRIIPYRGGELSFCQSINVNKQGSIILVSHCL